MNGNSLSVRITIRFSTFAENPTHEIRRSQAQ